MFCLARQIRQSYWPRLDSGDIHLHCGGQTEEGNKKNEVSHGFKLATQSYPRARVQTEALYSDYAAQDRNFGGLAAFLLAFGQSSQGDALEALFAARDWPGLQRALDQTPDQTKESSLLYRAALAIALNQDSRLNESRLRAVIRAAPHSDEAYEAYEQLMHLYLRTGRYPQPDVGFGRALGGFPREDKQPPAGSGVIGSLPRFARSGS